MKVRRILEGHPEQKLDPEEYIMLYTIIFNMCNQKHPDDHSCQLYDKYRETVQEYISSMVYEELKGKAKDVVIALIDREREGEMIDRALLKNVVDIYVEIGMGKMNYYVNDFENDMLAATAAYYSRKASNWIMKDSCPDYMLMAQYCLRKEKQRVSHYLHSSSEPKLLEKNVQNELLVVYS